MCDVPTAACQISLIWELQGLTHTPPLQVVRVTWISKVGALLLCDICGEAEDMSSGPACPCPDVAVCHEAGRCVSQHQFALLLRRLCTQVANSDKGFPDKADGP